MTKRFRAAARYATASLGDLADEAGYARITFDVYLNRKPPTAPATRALADALERRADELRRHAARLRESAGEAPAEDA